MWTITSGGQAACQGDLRIIQVIDDTVGNSATIDVDNLGFLSCIGTCGQLTMAFTGAAPHTTIGVFGKLGQFDITITAVAGASAIYPALQNLAQISTATTGAGRLNIVFTDTDYCLGGGGCFFPALFDLGLTNNPDSAISASSTSFTVSVDSANAIPAGTLVGSKTLAGNSAFASIYANPTGLTSGSLSTAISTVFTGKGTVATTSQVSAHNQPVCSERDHRAGLC